MAAESPRQEASDSTDASDKDFSCSVCGEEYDNQQALNSHKGHKHPDSTRVTVECDHCGNEKVVTQSAANKQDNHFCDNSCKYQYRSESEEWCGSNHHRYNRVVVNCDYCGNELERLPGRVERHDNMYCDVECQSKYRKQEGMYEGEDNPVYNSTTLECVQCGDEFTVPVSIADQGRKCCSKECGYEYVSETYSGKNSWNYTGYDNESYGDHWQETRDEVRERDSYECQDCGVNESELDRELDVHHIVPLRKFDTPKEANVIDNLISLCQSCHSKWEGLFLRPDSR
jgi:ribosomal protein S27E